MVMKPFAAARRTRLTNTGLRPQAADPETLFPAPVCRPLPRGGAPVAAAAKSAKPATNFRTLLLVCCGVLCSATGLRAEQVRFDIPPITVAQPASSEAAVSPLPGQKLIRIPLRLSALVGGSRPTAIDQLMVHVHCIDGTTSVVDYAPRTEVASPYAGSLEVSKTEEKQQQLGFSVDAGYAKVVNGGVGGDLVNKDTESVKFQRVAPVEIVAASGTFERGRGAYFKLRATPLQVLEGDKRFQLIVSVPDDWQTGLVEVRVAASGLQPRFGLSSGSEMRTLGRANYVVAAFLDEDATVRSAAMAFVEAEAALREAIQDYRSAEREKSSNLFRQLVAVIDGDGQRERFDWLPAVMRGRIDPHQHPVIRKLPVDVRVAILDYYDAQQRFLNRPATDMVVAGK